MTYFLRDTKNNTLFSMDFWTKTDYESDNSKYTFHEISTNVDIRNYSKLLLNTKEESQEIIIRLFDDLSEYRGWLWENYYGNKKNTGNEEDYNIITKHFDKTFKNIAETFTDLYYVTD